MGLSVSDAIRMLLTSIAADKALPFDINRVQAIPTPRGHELLPKKLQ